ncbi:putative thiol oxidoreductase [Largemouth bass virus]|uniref:Proliferating cell nuclear antigen n=1 Tax=Largemouth bass virus TaxID=176656 RepID=A0A9X7Y3C6_9VIRU|nr:hypothetical protein OA88_23150 [Flavobacterium sp. JRM]QJE49145.1 putative proliferating cell nuclear antigen [Largemouth bass virus]QJE49232.1 putative thiol oxidoreductase [Largemouth bass virus]
MYLNALTRMRGGGGGRRGRKDRPPQKKAAAAAAAPAADAKPKRARKPKPAPKLKPKQVIVDQYADEAKRLLNEMGVRELTPIKPAKPYNPAIRNVPRERRKWWRGPETVTVMRQLKPFKVVPVITPEIMLEASGPDVLKALLRAAPERPYSNVSDAALCNNLLLVMPYGMTTRFLRESSAVAQHPYRFLRETFYSDNKAEMEHARMFINSRIPGPPADRVPVESAHRIPKETAGQQLPYPTAHPRLMLPDALIVSIMRSAPWLFIDGVAGVMLPPDAEGALPDGRASKKWYIDNWVTIRQFDAPKVTYRMQTGQVFVETKAQYSAYVAFLQRYGKTKTVSVREVPPPDPETAANLISMFMDVRPEYASELASVLPTGLPPAAYESQLVNMIARSVPYLSGKPTLHIMRVKAGMYKPAALYRIPISVTLAEIYSDPEFESMFDVRVRAITSGRKAELSAIYRKMAAKDFTSKAEPRPALDARIDAPKGLLIKDIALNAMIVRTMTGRKVRFADPYKNMPADVADLLKTLRPSPFAESEQQTSDVPASDPFQLDVWDTQDVPYGDRSLARVWGRGRGDALLNKLAEYLDAREQAVP